MNAAMQLQTRQLLIRFCIILGLFTLLASVLAASIRYRTMLATTITNQETIARNMVSMQTSAKDTEKTVAGFRQLLPSGYGSQSMERLLYARLDELKGILKLADMTVKTIENKEGVLNLGFSASLPLRGIFSYTTVLNQLGQQETLAFPFVFIETVIVEQAAGESTGGLQIRIEGAVQIPAPQQQPEPGP